MYVLPILVLVLVLLGLFAFYGIVLGPSSPCAVDFTPQRLHDWIEQSRALVAGVRESYEHQRCSIKTPLMLSLGSLSSETIWAGRGPIFACCRSIYRSTRAVDLLAFLLRGCVCYSRVPLRCLSVKKMGRGASLTTAEAGDVCK